jgi:hypothetical protein
VYKPTAHLENQMILPDDFFLPFGGKLDKENRWVQLARLVPWAHAEKNYGQFFKDTFRGQHTLSLRMGLGALIIQERMQQTDRETLASISENPYMQYFIGLAGFEMKPPFHHSMMTHFRKRLKDVLAEINEIVATEGAKEMQDDDDDESDVNGGGMSRKGKRATKKSVPSDAAEQQTMFDEVETPSMETAIPATVEQAFLEKTKQPVNEPPSANEPLCEDRQESVTEAPSLPIKERCSWMRLARRRMSLTRPI